MKLTAADKAADYARQEAKAIVVHRRQAFLLTVAEITRLDPQFSELMIETIARGCGLPAPD